MKKILSIFLFSIITISSSFASSFFTGYAGGKIGYSAIETVNEDETTSYTPQLKLQAFFAGQINFSQNLWGHLEFSLDTDNFISETLFDATDSKFQIDEISLIARAQNQNFANYFSLFMGTYDPIGSDILLQRYFSMEKIASKLTDSWLGLAGSILYPHFGIGAADIFRFYQQPIIAGGYFYFNREFTKDEENFYVINTDLRFATNYRFFTSDFAFGLGLPLLHTYNDDDVLIVIDKVYLHAGSTLLIGNNYTQSLFMQAGIFNYAIPPEEASKLPDPENVYLLFEPRFTIKQSHLNISVFSLPKNTVEKLLYLDNTLGLNINLYSETLTLNGSPFSIGIHTNLSFQDKNYMNLMEFVSFFMKDTRCFDVNIIPYISTELLGGELNSMIKVECMKFIDTWYEAISADIGYKCRF